MARRSELERPAVHAQCGTTSRRGFLKASGWLAGSAALGVVLPGGRGFSAQAAPRKKMYGLIYFDTEDYISPPESPCHTLPGQLADIMHKHGLPGCFHIIGQRARFWERRRMTAVIESIKRHDVSLHYDRGSIHPTTAEEVSELDWFGGVDRVFFRELPGFQALDRIFRQVQRADSARRHVRRADRLRRGKARQAVLLLSVPPAWPECGMVLQQPAGGRVPGAVLFRHAVSGHAEVRTATRQGDSLSRPACRGLRFHGHVRLPSGAGSGGGVSRCDQLQQRRLACAQGLGCADVGQGCLGSANPGELRAVGSHAGQASERGMDNRGRHRQALRKAAGAGPRSSRSGRRGGSAA